MRPTKEFTTPNGVKLVLNEYMTERESRSIRTIFSDAIEYVESGASEAGFKSRITDKQFNEKGRDKTIEVMVVSYGAVTDKAEILRTLLEDVCKKEYDFVIESINSLTEEKKDT